jgi:hypothetical protein
VVCGTHARPLRAFFLRIRARRGMQIAAVAAARKLAIIAWHVLSKNEGTTGVNAKKNTVAGTAVWPQTLTPANSSSASAAASSVAAV